MRFLAIVVAGLVATAAVARADQRADLQARGEQLAKDGRYGEAIEQFKAADRIESRASHACLIALAYTRRELWPQAQLFLVLCHERAKAGDPLPDWVPLADQQIKERLATANVVEVAIDVVPASAGAKVTVSSFAPDEVFEPRPIYLPLGTHVIFARAPGFADQQKTIEIRDTTPQHVVIDLAPSSSTPVLTAPAPQGTKPSRLGSYLMIGGGIVGGLGVVSHLRVASIRRKLDDSAASYDENIDAFRSATAVTIGCYVVGAGLLVGGYILQRTSKREAATLSAVPLPEGGAFVSVGWSR